MVGQGHTIVISATRSGNGQWVIDIIDSLGSVTRAYSFAQLTAALHGHFVEKWQPAGVAVTDLLSFSEKALLEIWFLKPPKGASKAKGESACILRLCMQVLLLLYPCWTQC